MNYDVHREIERQLDIQELRKGFLSYTRNAYELLPSRKWPRVLDIGCGRGEVTLELARLTSGDVVGLDIDDTAFSDLRATIEREGLSTRVIIEQGSLFDVKFPDRSFDLLWEEGVLHILDPMRSIPLCGRLLKRGGFLVTAETVDWFEGKLQFFGACGFELVERMLWPKRIWWNDYYGPLEERIRLLREQHGGSRDLSELDQYAKEIKRVKADPEKFDCGHILFHKRD